MLYIDREKGGLRISRWQGEDPKPLESIFVAEDEIAGLLSELLAQAAGNDALGWDLWARLQGNPMTVTADD